MESPHPQPRQEFQSPEPMTGSQVLREITALRDIMTTRLDAMDRAVSVFHDDLVRVPTDVDKQVGALRSVMLEMFKTQEQQFATVWEKFSSVGTQFSERDTRGERESRDNKVAVDAAFAAQKEAAAKQDEANQKAIDKSEKATGETLAKQADLFQSTTNALDARITEIKGRLDRLEGTG